MAWYWTVLAIGFWITASITSYIFWQCVDHSEYKFATFCVCIIFAPLMLIMAIIYAIYSGIVKLLALLYRELFCKVWRIEEVYNYYPYRKYVTSTKSKKEAEKELKELCTSYKPKHDGDHLEIVKAYEW